MIEEFPLYFDKQRNPITDEEWARLWGDTSYRFLADEMVGDVRVVTIWEGIDHGMSGGLYIFESAIFRERHIETTNYMTEEDALKGHAAFVAQVRREQAAAFDSRPPRVWKKGDVVRITFEGQSARAEVLLASGNGKSLMLQFEAIVGGFVGMMPVLWNDATGSFEEIVGHLPVEVAEEG